MFENGIVRLSYAQNDGREFGSAPSLSTRKTLGKEGDFGAAVQCGGRTETARKPANLRDMLSRNGHAGFQKAQSLLPFVPVMVPTTLSSLFCGRLLGTRQLDLGACKQGDDVLRSGRCRRQARCRMALDSCRFFRKCREALCCL